MQLTDQPESLVLWDIDHTLLDAGTVWREAYAEAFAEVTGTVVSRFVPTDGRTELMIAREMLGAHDIRPEPDTVDRLLAHVAEATVRRAEAMRAAGTALPGAAASLVALATGFPTARQSVLTGNMRRIAALKLALFDLAGHLDLEIGAYGDDALERPDLVPKAWERARAVRGSEFSAANTVIIGDAVLDVVTATRAGAALVAVATGRASARELSEAGAQVVLTSLSDPAALVEAVRTATRERRGPSTATSRRHPGPGRRRASLSAVAMAHPSRAGQANALAARLGLDAVVFDPEPDATPSPLRTAIRAWRPGAHSTHHLVVQDDILAPSTFLDLVSSSVSRHPDSPIAFYSHWNSQNGALVRLAALAGAGWTAAVPDEYVPTQALCLPAPLADAFRRHAAAATTTADDVVMAAFLEKTGHRVLISVPNLVEHVGDTSLAGNSSHGLRRSACHVDDDGVDERLAREWVMDDVPCLPYMGASRTTRLILNVLHDRGRPERYLAWRDALPLDGLTVEAVEARITAVRDDAVHRSVSRFLGEYHASELWVYCLLLGWRAELAHRASTRAGSKQGRLDRLVEERALSTIGFSGLDPASRAAVQPAQADALHQYARQGTHAGRAMALTGVTAAAEQTS